MKQLSDEIIIQYLQSGEKGLQNKALRQLYSAYYGLAEQIIVKNSGTLEDVPDVFQNGLIVFYNKAKQPDFQLSSSIKTFLYSICRNLWLMELRKSNRNTTLKEQHEFIPTQESIFETLVVNEQKQLIVQLLKKMGESCQKVLEMFYFRKMKMAQIQKSMNYGSEQVAKNKKRTCMLKLRKMIMENPNYIKELRG